MVPREFVWAQGFSTHLAEFVLLVTCLLVASDSSSVLRIQNSQLGRLMRPGTPFHHCRYETYPYEAEGTSLFLGTYCEHLLSALAINQFANSTLFHESFCFQTPNPPFLITAVQLSLLYYLQIFKYYHLNICHKL